MAVGFEVSTLLLPIKFPWECLFFVSEGATTRMELQELAMSGGFLEGKCGFIRLGLNFNLFISSSSVEPGYYHSP